MDFTLKVYRRLLETLIDIEYIFVRFDDFLKENLKSSPYLQEQNSKIIILRHDVDKLPGNSLVTARIEKELGIKGTYYFRIVPESFDERIIKEIAGIGHEVGYHYEEIDLIRKKIKVKSKKDEETIVDQAYELFKINLAKLRSIAPITTICMHGSPLSPFDNKEIWKKYSYRDLGIIGEPYIDIDWNEFGYLTDTGRRWNGESVSVRDKVGGQLEVGSRQLEDKRLKEKDKSLEQWLKIKNRLRSTSDVIRAIEESKLPDKLMLTVHPQRWTDNGAAWLRELVWQNVKNGVKKVVVLRGRRTEVRDQRSG